MDYGAVKAAAKKGGVKGSQRSEPKKSRQRKSRRIRQHFLILFVSRWN